MKQFISKRSIVGAFIFLFLLLIPRFTSNQYQLHVINMMGIYILLSIGLNILMGYTGLMSLGQAGFYAVAGYTTSICYTKLGLNPWYCMLIGVAVTLVAGVIVSFPALRVKDRYLILLTISFAEIMRMVALNWTEMTGGPSGITGVKAPILLGINLGTANNFYYYILLCVSMAFLYKNYLINSRMGRALIAIREDQNAALLSGVNISKYKIGSFLINSFFCGLAGVSYAHYVHYVSPDTFVLDESINILCMCLVGGLGTMWGPLVGVISLSLVTELLRDFKDIRMLLYGILLIVIISFMPNGIIGSLKGFMDNRAMKKGNRPVGQSLPMEE